MSLRVLFSLMCCMCFVQTGAAWAAMAPVDMGSMHRRYDENDRKSKFDFIQSHYSKEHFSFDGHHKRYFSRSDFLPVFASFRPHGKLGSNYFFFHHHHRDVCCGHNPPSVPLPAALPLFGLGLSGLMLSRHSRKKI